ncbi:MAG: hypothetical protein APF81_25695 [Desulfosporosinus sp. BRH_c37]|nr:MAG: hypothetical protein APF81_25695 [Desulfosporosinus sp. BRH_c37]
MFNFSVLRYSIANRISRYRWMALLFKKQYLRYLADEEYKQYSAILKLDESWVLKLSDGFLPYIILILPILLVASGAFISSPDIKTDYILKVAGILAPFCAIMITVITFSVNIKKTSIPGSGPLLTIFTRKQGYIPIIASVMGTLMGIIILAYLPHPNKTQEFISFVEALLCIGLLFLLLKHTIEFLGKDDILSLLTDNLILRHRTALEQEVHYRLMMNIFHSEAKTMGFEINPFIDRPLNKGSYSIHNPGTIVDINLTVLKKISELITNTDHFISTTNSIKSDETSNKKPKLTLLPGEEILIDDIPATALVTEEDTHSTQIEMLLVKVFIIGKSAKKVELNWEEISQMLFTLIQQKDTKSVSAVMNSFNEVVKDYLMIYEQLGIEHSNPDIFHSHYSSYLPPSLYAIGFTKLFDKSFQVNSNESTSMLLGFLVKLAQIAWKYKSLNYYDDVLRTLIGIYRICTKFGDTIFSKQEITKYLNTIAIMTLRNVLDNEDVSFEQIKLAKPYTMIYLKNVLELIRRAVENNDGDMMEKTIAELDLWSKDLFFSDIKIEYQEKLEELAWQKENNSVDEITLTQSKIDRIEVYLEFQEYKELSILVAGGWAQLLIEKGRLDITKSRNIINRFITHLGDLQNIIQLRLFLGFSDARIDVVEKALGFDWWDYQEHRSMEVFSMPVAENWLIDFWIVIALKTVINADEVNVDNFLVQGRLQNLNFSEFTQRISNFQVSTDSRQYLLEGVDVPLAKNKILEIFLQLRNEQEENERMVLASKALSESKTEQRKLEFLEGYYSESYLVKLLAKNSVSIVTNNLAFPMIPQSFVELVAKEGLVDDWHTTYSWNGIGKQVARQHLLCYFNWLEKSTCVGGELEDSEETLERISHAIFQLKERQLKPSIMLIPPNKIRIRKILFTHRDNIELFSKKKDGFLHWVCMFDGIDVFTWPHQTSSIAIYDMDSFIQCEKRTHFKGNSLDFKLRQPTEEDIQIWVRNKGEVAQRELTNCNNLETLRNTKILLEVLFNFRLGINDINAGIKVIEDTPAQL